MQARRVLATHPSICERNQRNGQPALRDGRVRRPVQESSPALEVIHSGDEEALHEFWVFVRKGHADVTASAESNDVALAVFGVGANEFRRLVGGIGGGEGPMLFGTRGAWQIGD